MNSYELSRAWFDFCFENPEKIKPNHTAVYFFSIEHCNRLGWKNKFGLPTTMVMEAVGIKSYNTYIKTLRELVDWGFIKMIEKSKNQYSANIIALSKNVKALDKALDKALIKHTSKQSESTRQSTSESIGSIDKQLNNKPIKPIKPIKQRNKGTILLSEIKISDEESKDFLYVEIAKAFQQLFIKNLEEKNSPTVHQKKATYKNYVDPIRLMFEKDEVTKNQIEIVFKYLKSTEAEFWKPNILSTSKLREKFTTLLMKAQEKPSPNQSRNEDYEARKNLTNAELAKRAMESEVGKNYRFS